jgi:hypothetical protein
MKKLAIVLALALLCTSAPAQVSQLPIGPQLPVGSGGVTIGTNPAAFGARCDGATDDTAAFNAAFLAASASTPASISIPSGTCIINPATIANNTFSAPVSIIGQGAGASILKLIGGSTLASGQILFTWNTAGNGVTVSGVTIDLNGATVPAGLGGAFDFVATNQVTFRNNAIINGGSSGFLYIQAYAVTGCEIAGNRFQLTTASANQNQAINLGSSGNLVNDCDIHDNLMVNTAVGIFFADKLRFCNNEIYGWGFGGGVTLGPNDTTLRKIAVCNNSIHDSLTTADANGTHLNGVENWFAGAEITGNRTYKTAGQGILNAGAQAHVVGNWIGDSGTYVKGAINQLGALTAGTTYTNGYYTCVALTGGTGNSATANILVAGTVVTHVSLCNSGSEYTAADTLSAAAANIGGTGSGFSIPVSSILGLQGAGIFAQSNGTEIATGATYQGNMIYEDGGGHTSYGIGDTSAGTTSSIVGTNSVQGTTNGYYQFFGQVTYTSTPTNDNRAFNPCFAFDQRNEGGAVTASATYVADKWKNTVTNATFLSLASQVASMGAQAKCSKELKITVASGGNSPAAGDNYRIFQPIELNQVYDLGYSTINPQTLFLDFCARASAAGTYSWSLQNTNSTWSFVNQYVLGTNAVRCFSFQIPGDTHSLGATLTNQAFALIFDTGSGTNSQTSTIGTWVTGAFNAATNSTQLVSAATNATLEINEVRLYASNEPRQWVPRTQSQEHANLQRYYTKTIPLGTAAGQNKGIAGALTMKDAVIAGTTSVMWNFPVQMRAAPTITTYNYSTTNANCHDATNAADLVVTVDPDAAKSVDRVMIQCAAGGTAADNIYIHADANADF